MAKLFGTDGIRGQAYEPPLDRRTVSRVGEALAANLETSKPRVLLGRDTRASGPDIESWLTAGLVAAGAEVVSMGVITTPAVAFVTRRDGFDAGVVISASHNPYRDNGIKIFMGGGLKSSEALETRIEEQVLASSSHGVPAAAAPSPPDPALEAHYLDHLVAALEGAALPPDLTLALDCAHGAGYRIGPRLLARLGVRATSIGVSPDGTNINRDCGSTHIETLAETVTREGLALGAALDGDGDRLLLVDRTGRLVDGDAILLLCARRMKREGRLERGVVATVMSNMALELALREEGLELHRTPVGDKFVAMEMAERRIILGGEQSGHIIFSDFASTGDGLLTLVQVLRVLALEGMELHELGALAPFPQVLVNVAVRERPDVREVPEIAEAVALAESRLRERGRVLIRYSGTEPLLRIMMEGPDARELETLSDEVRRAVETTIGAEA